MSKEQLEKELFDIVYQWGRVGIKTDEKCKAFQDKIKEIKNFNSYNTGLKDKNGKEIFKGDIIKKVSANFVQEVVFENAMYLKRHSGGVEDELLHIDIDWYEVIGK